MWDWAHFKNEGWITHTKRSVKFSGLLLLSSLAMALHAFVPFWLQPTWLRAESVARDLCKGMESRKE